MTASLHELTPGRGGWIVRVGDGSTAGLRMADLGVTPGTWVEVKRVAPAGDPIEISVRGYRLLMRKSEASHILVRVNE